jgi:translation initiation factor 6
MAILRTNFHGDPNIGLYGFATDKYCLSGMRQPSLNSVLRVPLRASSLLHTNFASLFAAGNSSGIAVARVVNNGDLAHVFENILVLDTQYTAVGNLMLLNDKGIILSPFLRKHKDEIKKFFGLHCEIVTIAGTRIVGSAGIATNKGCLVHPLIKQKEKNIVEETLQVGVDIGTVNFGSPFVKAGVIANSNALVVSDACSGPELGRISEVLGFV